MGNGQIKILAFAGSTRTGSFNKQLIRVAAEGARATGAEVTLVDLRDLALPLFDGDLEADHGLPEGAKRFKNLLRENHGLLIASPEYNSSITGVLKNAIDWASREESDDEPPLVAFRGKVAALMSASPGALGGLRGLIHLRAILGNIGVIVLPDQVTVPKAYEAFDDSGHLKDDRKRKQVMDLAEGLTNFLAKHLAAPVPR
jgi:NAD(P)H-dependent FMN reductase